MALVPSAQAVLALPDADADGLSTAATCDVAPSLPMSSFPLPGPDLSCIATHSQRNPQMVVQEARVHPVQSDAQKATADLRRLAEREKQELLATDLSEIIERQREEMEDLANKHATTVEHIEKLINHTPHYRRKVRSINIENAKIHAKGEEVNADLPRGSKHKLSELRVMVKEDPAFQNMSEEATKILLDDAQAWRDQKRVGARPSNKSVAQDYRHAVKSINTDIEALEARTGAASIAFFTRTHMNDTFEPNHSASVNAANFCQDVLGMGMWDVSRLFEQWACTQGLRNRNPNTFNALRVECTNLINGGLRTVAQSKKAHISYEHYETRIVRDLRVKLVGYTYHPTEIIISPYSIPTVGDLLTLRDALVSGACHWVRLTPGEVNRHMADLASREAAGEIVTKKRKERSDKGTVKGPRKSQARTNDGVTEGEDQSDNDIAGPSKKKKVATKSKAKTKGNGKATTRGKGKENRPSKKNKKSQLPSSKAFIADTDEEDDEV